MPYRGRHVAVGTVVGLGYAEGWQYLAQYLARDMVLAELIAEPQFQFDKGMMAGHCWVRQEV